VNVDDAPQNGRDTLPRMWGWHTILSALATAVILGFLATLIDWQNTWHEFHACHKGYVLLGAMCHYLTYPVRGARWRQCMAHLSTSKNKAKFGMVVFFHNFVDNIIPGKLGDIYGAHLGRINFGVSRSEAIGSIVFQRMIDAWIVVSLSFAASTVLLPAQLPESLKWALFGGCMIAVIASLIMLLFFFLDRAVPDWVAKRFVDLIRAFRKGMWPKGDQLFPILGNSALIWLLETLWVYFLARGFGLSLSPGSTLFLTMLPLLATAFPLTPAGAGVVELTLFSCLRVVGVDAPLATSITLLNRFIDYWLHIGLGVLVWTFSERLGLRTWREEAASPPLKSCRTEGVEAASGGLDL
jgi:uncharacterized protein (TIRG00374 family)